MSLTGSVLKPNKGFSLIELLVVMVLVAVAAVGVTTAINPKGSVAKQLNQQGDILFAQMQYALDEALFSHNALGLVVKQDDDTGLLSTTYEWFGHDGDQWVKRKEPLGEATLKEGLSWQITVEDTPLEESLDDLLDEDEGEVQPLIAFYPSGEMTEFVIELTLSEQALADNVDANGDRYKISVNNRGTLVRYQVGEVEE